MKKANLLNALVNLGFAFDDAKTVRRISMTLHRWHERECGDGNGCIERDEVTGKAYWLSSHTGKRWPTPDREKGALKRLGAIMARHPDLWVYQQGDPRGCALYVGRKDGETETRLDSVYYRGLAVCDGGAK